MAGKHLFSAATLAILALAACNDSPTGGLASLDSDEAQLAASDWDQISTAVIDGMGPLFSVQAGESRPVTATTTTTFTRTRTCAISGSVTVTGQRVVTNDPDARTGTMSMNATRTDSLCTFPMRRRDGTITINGNPNVALTANHSWTNGVPGIRTTTHKGSFTWTRSGGRTGTCAVDLTATWNPATHTYTLKGTFCNHTVDITRTHTP